VGREIRKGARQTKIGQLMQESQNNKRMVCAGPSILHCTFKTLLLVTYIIFVSYVNKVDPKLVDMDVSKASKQLSRELRAALIN